MSKRLTGKLKSERGATLSLALLLVLVCLAVSSVLLAASTAAAGQLAKRGELDSRYYSVKSAAELFEDVVVGRTAVIEVELTLGKPNITYKEKTDVTDSAPDGLASLGENDLLYQITTPFFPASDSAGPNWRSGFEYSAWLTSGSIRGFKLTPELPDNNDEYTVNATAKYDASGLITLVFSNTIASKSENSSSYLTVTLAPDVWQYYKDDTTLVYEVRWDIQDVSPGKGGSST